MIVDTHAHLGHDYVFDEDVTEEELLFYCDGNNIDHAIIQPCISRPYPADTMQIHNEIYDLCKRHKGRFFGMASINPHLKAEDYDSELKRCISELGFVGVKITPIGHAAHPSSRDCMHVYEMCRELGVPVMVHTGSGAPFADPVSLFDAVRAFPGVKFVLAHAGTDLMFQQALYLARECSNVYLEPSWLNVYSVKAAVKVLGAGRVMFSSDMPANIPVELAKYRVVAEDAAMLEQLLSKTAIDVFGLSI